MSNEGSGPEEGDRAGGPRGQSTDDTLVLRLPAKSDYLPVLRATLGVIAGSMSFNYDEVLQLRVAASEAYSLAIRHFGRERGLQGSRAIAVSFVIETDRLLVLVSDPYAGHTPADQEAEMESRAVLESLVDSVEFGVEAEGERVTRLVKRKSASQEWEHTEG